MSRRRKKRSFFGQLFKCGFMVGAILIGILLLDKVLNGDGQLSITNVIDNMAEGKVNLSAKTVVGDVEIDEEELLQLPESLQRLYEKNPEARKFIADYPEKHDVIEDIDVSDQVEKGEIPLFIQWDERWGYREYGNDMMAVNGCGPTALAMVYVGLTGDASMNPYKMSQLAYDRGYYVEGSGSSWSMMTELADYLGLSSRELGRDEGEMMAALNNGSVIICTMGPGDFTESGHFIVIAGMEEDGSLVVRDSNSIERSTRTWDVSTIMDQMKNWWVISP